MQDLKAGMAMLVGSRLCHDLISPVGAIQNGLELLSMTQDVSSSEEFKLMQESCAAANARVRFFRIAFGAVGPDQFIGDREIRAILADFNLNARHTVIWNASQDIARATAQMLFLGILCAETALPFGGDINVMQDGDASVISATGRKVQLDTDMVQALGAVPDPAQMTPAKVQFSLLSLLSLERGILLVPDLQDDRFVLRIG